MNDWFSIWLLHLAPSITESVDINDPMVEGDNFTSPADKFNADPSQFINTIPEDVISKDNKDILIRALNQIRTAGIKPNVIFDRLITILFQNEALNNLGAYKSFAQLIKEYEHLKCILLSEHPLYFFPAINIEEQDTREDIEAALKVLDRAFQLSIDRFENCKSRYKPKQKGICKTNTKEFIISCNQLLLKHGGLKPTQSHKLIADLLSAILRKEFFPENVKTHIASSKKHPSKK